MSVSWLWLGRSEAGAAVSHRAALEDEELTDHGEHTLEPSPGRSEVCRHECHQQSRTNGYAERNDSPERQTCENVARPMDAQHESACANRRGNESSAGDGGGAEERSPEHEHGDEEADCEVHGGGVGRVARREGGLAFHNEPQ